MASFSFPPLVPPTTTLPHVEPVTAAIPAAVITAEAETLPFSLPQASPAPAAAAPAPGTLDAAALRPDQVMMSRQLSYPAADGAALATAWRGMVQTYAAQLTTREQQARAGQLPAALLIATQDGRIQRGIDASGAILADAWRFTVHARGPQEQHLSMVTGEPDQKNGRRRRGRAALRLELELADGTRVLVQAEALPGGVGLELCAPSAAGLARLREMQPVLEVAIGRAGVRVLRWRYRESMPAGQIHARLPSAEAASALSLPVFRAMAELALLLPAPAPSPEG